MAKSSASILAKLKNKAKSEGLPFQQMLNLFCQEEFIRRLSKSKYSKQLILKGGFLLYSISGFATRPTVDADYLLRYHSNEIESIKLMVQKIINQELPNNFISLSIRNVEKISEIKKYHGIRVNLMGNIGATHTPFSIDFGVGDIIVPSSVQRTLPVLLDDFPQPKILTYSLESTVSEKFDAIISLMEATGRMKDFYDIYYIANSFEIEGIKLQEAISETLSNRGTPYEKDSVEVIERLVENQDIQKRWINFCKKVLRYELNFSSVINRLIDFVNPPFQAMVNEEELLKTWDPNHKQYI